ncbi:MAG: Dethiobiotin synthetase [Acidimicrobiales bacterium]|nr:Dethiobiotin synthetase [Acidimicrobiales bacterium]
MPADPASPIGPRPEGPRPDRLILAVGTATEIGKTWFGARTIEALVAGGHTVAARKPAQSFDPAIVEPTDADVLGAATGEAPETVCPAHRWYEVPMAPPMAADALGRPAPTTAELLAEMAWPTPAAAIGWIETVGGPRSPIAADGDAVTFASRLDPDLVVLVADAGLGTINAVILSAAPFAGHRVVVALNRWDPDDDLHRRNHEWLCTRQGLEVVVDPEALAALITSDWS